MLATKLNVKTILDYWLLTIDSEINRRSKSEGNVLLRLITVMNININTEKIKNVILTSNTYKVINISYSESNSAKK